MKKLINKITIRVRGNLKGIKFEGMTLTIILVLLFMFISSNIIRVYTNGRLNYDTYLKEKEDLDKLRQKHEELKKNYEYYTSDEFKLLLLRDTQSLAQSNEELFQTKEIIDFYFEQPTYMDIKAKENFEDWWKLLLF